MSEHTKEQWHHGGTQVSTKEDLIRIFSESIDAHIGDIGQYFMEIYSEDGKRIAFLAGPTSHANAHRIVACVNACACMPTDDLEASPNMGLFHLAEFANEMVIQRDELLAALKSMLYIFDRGLDDGMIGRNICDEAKAAISKVK